MERPDALWLNITLTALAVGVWLAIVGPYTLATYDPIGIPLPMSDTPQNAVSLVLFVGFYLFGIGVLVLRHIFLYGYAKTTDFDITCRWVWGYWRWFLLLLVGLVFAYINVFLATLLSLIAGWQFKEKLAIELAEEFVEGRRPWLPRWVQQRFDAKRHSGDPGLDFGDARLPLSEANTHFAWIGTSGSGKTNLFLLYLQSVSRYMLDGSGNRLLLFDPKTEFLPYLTGMGFPLEKIKILNIFHASGSAYDMAKDLTRDRDMNQLAKILIPEENSANGNEFFSQAARRIFSGVGKILNRICPEGWDLRDLVLASQSLELVTILLSQDPVLRMSLQALGEEKTASNVMATIAAKIGGELETIAAYVHFHLSEGRAFTLKEWMLGDIAALLGCDMESEATLQPYNKLLFTLMCNKLLSQKEPIVQLTFFLIDELPALGRIGPIDSLADKGRSKKVSLNVAYQTDSKLQDIYNDKLANNLMAQFDKVALLRMKDRSTAQWACDKIGEMEVIWKPISVNDSVGQAPFSGTHGEGYGQSIRTKKVARVEDFMSMAKPDKDELEGVKGWFIVDDKVYRHEISSQYLSQHLPSPDPLTEAYVEAPRHAETLHPWDEEDIQRLGLYPLLSQFDEEKLKRLPIAEWVSFASHAPSLPGLEGLAE